MMLTGKHVPAEEAFKNGIIDEIAPNDKTVENGISYAQKLISEGFDVRPTSKITSKIDNLEELHIVKHNSINNTNVIRKASKKVFR